MGADGHGLACAQSGVALALLLTLLLGCGAALSPAFDSRMPDNDAARTAAALALGAPAAAESGAARMLAVTGADEQRELALFDVHSGTERWRRALSFDTRPQLLGNLVVTRAGRSLIVLDANDGAMRFRATLPLPALFGVARSGDRLFVVTGTPTFATGARHSNVSALDARNGRTLWTRGATGAAGRPAASGDLVLVPWQRQSLVMLDARDGRELARTRTRDDVIDWVESRSGVLRVGGQRIRKLAPEPAASSMALALPVGGLPGSPRARPSAFEELASVDSARGRVGLTVDFGTGPTPSVAHDRLYLIFYRHIFAFDAQGVLRWGVRHPRDVVATRSLGEGLLLADEGGGISLLARETGQPRWQQQLAGPLAAARFDHGALDLPPVAQSMAKGTDLRRTLVQIALDPDNRLVPARAFAVQHLARLEHAEVTRDLLDIYGQTSTPPELKRVVADALRTRRAGSEFLVDALLRRYDFLDLTRPAPLSVIVPALVEAEERRAVPLLVERMLDHETPTGSLPAVVSAVVELGDASVVAPLASFLRLYRADSSVAQVPEALIEAARGILVHGGPEGAQTLAASNGDGRASAPVAAGIASLLEARAVPAETAIAVTPTVAPQPLPGTLTQAMIDRTFAEHADALRGCVIEELGRNPKLSQVRIAFVAEADGSTHALSFVPSGQAFVDCLYPSVTKIRFPEVAATRTVGRSLTSGAPIPAPDTDEYAGAPGPENGPASPVGLPPRNGRNLSIYNT